MSTISDCRLDLENQLVELEHEMRQLHNQLVKASRALETLRDGCPHADVTPIPSIPGSATCSDCGATLKGPSRKRV